MLLIHSLYWIRKKPNIRPIPSTPSVKFKFKLENQKNFTTNWNEPVDFWKKPHRSNEVKNDSPELFRAMFFNSFSFSEGINNNNKIPIIGNIIIKTNKLSIYAISFNLNIHLTGFEPITFSLENCCSIRLS